LLDRGRARGRLQFRIGNAERRRRGVGRHDRGAAGTGGAATGGSQGATGGAGGVGNTGGTAGSGVAFTIGLWAYATGAGTAIDPYIEIFNHGLATLPLTGLEIRYWFTSDLAGASGVTQSAMCQSQSTVGITCNDFSLSLVPVTPARPTADTYLSWSFGATTASVGPAGGYADILVYITRSDGIYDQSNDYSYNGSASYFAETTKVTAYDNGTLIYGTEP
jgi:hypothetical protein